MKKQAFTLVELIVVITILAILATIAFISFSGFSQQSRNSSRASDVKTIEKGLSLFHTRNNYYPDPENPSELSFSGSPVLYQGTFGNSPYTVTSTISNIPVDPLTSTEYIYSVTNNKTEYEILTIYEGEIVKNSIVNSSYANQDYKPKVQGTYNKIFVKTNTHYIPLPSIINSEIDGATILDSNNIDSFVITNGDNLPAWGDKITNSQSGGLDINLSVYTGSINSSSNDTEKENLMNAIQGAYSGSVIDTNILYSNILDDTSTQDKVDFVNTVILKGEVSSSTPATNYSCDESSRPTDNGYISFVVGTATSNNQSYVQDASNCGYSCTDGYTGTDCNTPPGLVTSSQCSNAGWIWVDSSNDVYIGANQGNGFCISPRYGDWGDTNDGTDAISFNGWGNNSVTHYNGWDTSSIEDSVNTQEYGQTRVLESQTPYNCLNIGSATSDYITSDTLVGRMEWLATTGNNYSQATSISWIVQDGTSTPLSIVNGHAIPALYIADCIDGTKDLGNDMDYKHHPDENLNETITYSQYSTEETISAAADLNNSIYLNRQKYLTAWTQSTGSHLPSAMSYISNGTIGNYLSGNDRGEYQVACEAGLFGAVSWNGTQYTGANDDSDAESVWLSAIGSTSGTNWVKHARILGASGCGDQVSNSTGRRDFSKTARFVIRP